MTGSGDARRTGARWLWGAAGALVLCLGLVAIGFSAGPRVLGTLGIVGVVAPVLLALRGVRERGR